MAQDYIGPYTDFGFRRLFGQAPVLTDFFNAVLPEQHRITSLEYRSTDDRPRIRFEYLTMFDTACMDKLGKRILVKFLKREPYHFPTQSLFYPTFPIKDMAANEFRNSNIRAVYFVGLLYLHYDDQKERQRFFQEADIPNPENDDDCKKIHFVFLRMDNFKKTELELETHLDQWLFFLTNVEFFGYVPTTPWSEKARFETIPEPFKKPVFERALKSMDLSTMSRQEQAEYESYLRHYRDNYATLKYAYDEAYEKAYKESVNSEIAWNMKRKGYEVEAIAEITGLSLEEIERLE